MQAQIPADNKLAYEHGFPQLPLPFAVEARRQLARNIFIAGTALTLVEWWTAFQFQDQFRLIDRDQSHVMLHHLAVDDETYSNVLFIGFGLMVGCFIKLIFFLSGLHLLTKNTERSLKQLEEFRGLAKTLMGFKLFIVGAFSLRYMFAYKQQL